MLFVINVLVICFLLMRRLINGSGAKIKLKTVEKVRDDVYQNEDIIHLIALILIMEYHMWASTPGHSFRIGKS